MKSNRILETKHEPREFVDWLWLLFVRLRLWMFSRWIPERQRLDTITAFWWSTNSLMTFRFLPFRTVRETITIPSQSDLETSMWLSDELEHDIDVFFHSITQSHSDARENVLHIADTVCKSAPITNCVLNLSTVDPGLQSKFALWSIEQLVLSFTNTFIFLFFLRLYNIFTFIVFR